MKQTWSTDEDSAPLDDRDRIRIAHVESCLNTGLALKLWWDNYRGVYGRLDKEQLLEQIESGDLSHWFPLTQSSSFCGEDISFGFFDQAQIGGKRLPIQGRSQRMFFDRPMVRSTSVSQHSPQTYAYRMKQKQEIVEFWRSQLESFILTYSLNASNFKSSKAPYFEKTRRPLARYLAAFSAYPTESSDDSITKGFTHQKIYYKSRDNGRIGKFRKQDQTKIDLRSIGPEGKYEWLVIKIRIYETNLRIGPTGNKNLHFVFPFESTRYAILTRDFIFNESRPTPEVLAEYGYGYALLNDPTESGLGPNGFQTLKFQIDTEGVILASTVRVTLRPEQLLPFTTHPTQGLLRLAEWFSMGALTPITRPLNSKLTSFHRAGSLDLTRILLKAAATLTGGWTEEVLGLSEPQLQRLKMISDAIGFLNAIENVGYIWRLIPDWTHSDALPEWIKL